VEQSHVAYLTSEYPKTSHTFILREVEALRALGLEVTTCSIRKPDIAEFGGEREQQAWRTTFFVVDTARRAPHQLLVAHLRLLVAPGRWLRTLRLAWRTRSPGTKAALWSLFYFLEAGLLAAHLRRVGARHLHNHFSNPSCTVAMLASELSGIPFSFTAHGPEEFFRPYENALSEKIARARLVVAISHFCRSQLMLFSDPAQWDKISIVHCGIEPELYMGPPRETFGKRVLFVGRLTPEKGGALLLEAFAQVFAAHPEARLTVVGDGPERPALEARAQALGVAEAVTFAGARNQLQVAAHMAEADMLVLPSFAEGVPVVLMEAMAAGLPTIASRVAGVSELVHDEETGFVIPPGDLETLANRLSRLMSNPNLCRNMGASGRAVVEADYVVWKEAAWLARLLAGSGEGELRPMDAEPS
jgi:glycosyltransferase involved in cell wall biosynthesis